MESKKKMCQVHLDEQILKLNDYITQRISIEAAKNDEHYADMMQKLIGVQNQVDQHSKDIKEALTKRSAESTKMHDISDKLADQHYNKLHDLVKDCHAITNSNGREVVIMMKEFLDVIKHDHEQSIMAIKDSTLSIRMLIGMSVVNLLFFFMFLYRFLTWLR